MGVYQSATEPKVRSKSYREVVSGDVVESVGKRNLIRWMRKHAGIPSKVNPEESLVYGGWEFSFQWFEVETFN